MSDVAKKAYFVAAGVTLLTMEYDEEQAELRMREVLKDLEVRQELEGRGVTWRVRAAAQNVGPQVIAGGDSIGL